MDAILKLININYLNISQFAFQTNPNAQRIFQDLDELIIQKDSFTEFIKFEYTTAIVYNTIIAFPSLIYFFSKVSALCSCDLQAAIWILFVSLVKVLEIIPKAIIIYQTNKIVNSSPDELIASRRLKYLTRSNLFLLNTILGYALFASYSVFFLFVRKSNICEGVPQFHFIINWLIISFFLRLIISFINYFLHFKYAVNEADIEQTNFYKDYNNRLSKELIELIETVQLTQENIKDVVTVFNNNETDFCCICMLQYEVEDKVKVLPCNKKHVFHNNCIDKWLSHNKNCPTCRTEISKNLLNKEKF
jgi:hypothetical protein